MKFEDVTNVYPGKEAYPEKERPLILKLGQKITDRKFRKVNYKDPEYYGLAAFVSDEEAKIALKMKLRQEYSIEEMMKLTKKLGYSQKELEDKLFHMGYTGLIEWHYHEVSGERKKYYVLPRFVMASAEFSNMRKEQITEKPQISRFFERMTFDPLNGLTPIIPLG